VNASDVADLITFINSYDARVEVSRSKTEAWALALSDGISYDFAHNAVVAHYATKTSAIMPADFNAEFKRRIDEMAVKTKGENINKELSYAEANKATPEQVAYWKGFIAKTLKGANLGKSEF
jgi:hypothetical protein